MKDCVCGYHKPPQPARMRSAVVTFCLLLVLGLELRSGDASPVRKKFSVLPSERSPREGQTLTLSCIMEGSPQASIPSPSSFEWVKDGKVIPGQTGQTLTIQEVTVLDEADYQCGPPGSDAPREIFYLDVINVSGAQSRPHRIVRRSVGSLTHETFYPDEYGSNLEGRPLRLRCYHFGPPSIDRTATFEWLKNGEVIPEETKQDIYIKSLTKQDEGDYMCGIQGSDVPRKTHYLQVLSILPRPSVIAERLPVCGQKFFLECIIVSGYKRTDTMVYTWYKDSTKIEGQLGPLLRFDDVTKADTGNYQCTARDGLESTTSPQSAPYDVTPFVSPEIFINTLTPDSVVRAILGDSLTLTCEVTQAVPRVPTHGYTWSYLPSMQGPLQPLSSKTKSLTLNPLTKGHSGQYTCQARNDQNFTTITMIGRASITVDVVYLESIHLTPVMSPEEGDWVTLTCSVDSHPTAHLSWFVDGTEVRRVVDNVDHFVIPEVTCADSSNYTCLASNTDVPGRDVNATTELLVTCNNDQQNDAHLDTKWAGISAQLNFSLPKQTAMVLVHPSGEDILTVNKECSHEIFSGFASRCHYVHCDLTRRHLFLTLSQITVKDEGSYICEELGPQRKVIPNCQHELHLTKLALDSKDPSAYVYISIIVFLLIIILIVIPLLLIFTKRYEKVKAIFCREILLESELESLLEWKSLITGGQGKKNSFDSLYSKGRVYVFPQVKLSSQTVTTETTEEGTEKTQLLHSVNENHSYETYEEEVKDRMRHTLQTTSGTEGLPSFILHNISLGNQKNVMLILSRKVGVVLMMVMSAISADCQEMVKNLAHAKEAVTDTLKGLVKPDSITLVIASETQSEDYDLKIKQEYTHQKLDVLVGQSKADFEEWSSRLSRRPDSDVWNWMASGMDSADVAYKIAAGKFLTLNSSQVETPAWLLTPKQVEVRDSTANLLHMYGTVGEGKKTLLIHKAEQWLTEGKAVILAVGRQTYNTLLAGMTEAMLNEQGKERNSMIRVCCTSAGLDAAIKDLRYCNPETEICLVTDILDSEIFKNILKVAKKEISAVWSAGTTDLHRINAKLSEKAHDLGWESIHLPPRIRRPNSTVHLMNLLGSRQPVDHSPSPDQATPPDRREWTVVDHCLHKDQMSSLSPCAQCKGELSAALPSTEQNGWANWAVFHRGEPDVSTDVDGLLTKLQGLGAPISPETFASNPSRRGSLQTTHNSGDVRRRRSIVDIPEEPVNPAAPLVKIGSLGSSNESQGILLIHWDVRDMDKELQSPDDKEARLNAHRQEWTQAAAKCKGQVILLLLTPSPARSLLSLPDPLIQ